MGRPVRISIIWMIKKAPKTTMKPMRALVIMLEDCWSFLGSPPALAMNINPPTRTRIRRMMPLRVRAFLRRMEMRVAILGKVEERSRLPQGMFWPMFKANTGFI